MGEWFRYILGGRNSGLTTTVVADLQQAIRALKRTRPHVVLFVEEGAEKVDDRLLLLRALLLIEEQCHQNTLTILYNPAEDRMTMYHNVYFPRVKQLDVAMAVKEGANCPLFGDVEEETAGFPKDCCFLPLMTTCVAHPAGAAVGTTKAARETREGRDED